MFIRRYRWWQDLNEDINAAKTVARHGPSHGRPLRRVTGTRDLDDPKRKVSRMPERHWEPQPGDAQLIREHLERQKGLPPNQIRLVDGRIVRVGLDAEGEGDDECQ